MKAEDSYYTAPEDVSVSKVDQSFVVWVFNVFLVPFINHSL